MKFPISIFSKKVLAAIQSNHPAYDGFNLLMAVASIILGKLETRNGVGKSKPVLIATLIGRASIGKTQAKRNLYKTLKGLDNKLSSYNYLLLRDSSKEELLLTSWGGDDTIINSKNKSSKKIKPFCHISTHQMAMLCSINFKEKLVFNKTLFVLPDTENIKQNNINIKSVRKILKAISKQTAPLKNQEINLSKSAYEDYLSYRKEIVYTTNLTENQFLKSRLYSFDEYALRFALIFEVLANYDKEKIDWSTKKITQKSTKKAIQLMRYFHYTSNKVVTDVNNGFRPRVLYRTPKGA